MSNICYCSVGLHEECVVPITHDAGMSCCCWADEEQVLSNLTYVAPEVKRGRPTKDNDEVGDILSTGRKRAAAAFPVEDGMLCEWSYLLYAGGGVEPIVGCKGTVLYAEKGKHALHHGPDKNTLNNEEGNVHRICTLCHNRWHTLNDQYYGKRPDDGTAFVPLGGVFHNHDPDTQATEEQVQRSETYWSTPIKQRGELR